MSGISLQRLRRSPFKRRIAIDKLLDRVMDFYASVATVAFGVMGFSSAMEILATAARSTQEFLYWRSVVFLAFLIMLGAMLPLAFEGASIFNPGELFGTGGFLQNTVGANYYEGTEAAAYSFVLAMLAIVLMTFQIIEVASGAVRVQFPVVFFALLLPTIVSIGALVANAIRIGDPHVYKAFLLWALIVLLVRFLLFVKHLTTRKA